MFLPEALPSQSQDILKRYQLESHRNDDVSRVVTCLPITKVDRQTRAEDRQFVTICDVA
jgi:hypothetical protein